MTPIFLHLTCPYPAASQLESQTCTVVFHIAAGAGGSTWLLNQLTRHFERTGKADIVKFQVGDQLALRDGLEGPRDENADVRRN
ncbi:MAG: hypothetical protein ACOH2P_15270 [Pseudomonas sp.]